MRITVTIEILDSEFKPSDLDGLNDAIRYTLTESLVKGNVYGFYDVTGKHQNWYVPENTIVTEVEYE